MTTSRAAGDPDKRRHKDRRLYLFDIDGTLLASGGAGEAAMRAALKSLWRIEDALAGVAISGRTDRAIFRDALRCQPERGDAFEAEIKRFKRAYYPRLRGTLHSHKGRLLPGVEPLLRRLTEDEHATLALGTGNFRAGAALKLAHYGIGGYFRGGGFGDRTEERAAMIASARRAAERLSGRHATVVVIGDTVHDIRAARDNGFVAVGVATGSNNEAQLSDAGADLVLPSLEGAAKHLLPA